MRTWIKVADLTSDQREHLHRGLLARYDIPEGAVRVHVEFEMISRPPEHAEMPVRAFVRLMTQLQRIYNHAEPVQEGKAMLCGCSTDRRCALHSGWRDEATGLISGGLVTDDEGEAELPLLPAKWSAPLSQMRQSEPT